MTHKGLFLRCGSRVCGSQVCGSTFCGSRVGSGPKNWTRVQLWPRPELKCIFFYIMGMTCYSVWHKDFTSKVLSLYNFLILLKLAIRVMVCHFTLCSYIANNQNNGKNIWKKTQAANISLPTITHLQAVRLFWPFSGKWVVFKQIVRNTRGLTFERSWPVADGPVFKGTVIAPAYTANTVQNLVQCIASTQITIWRCAYCDEHYCVHSKLAH